MPLYRVHFTWKSKEMELRARSLDLTHPYFVSIKDILLPEGPRIIINPAQDELLKTFGEARHLMIPFQTVQLIEELPDEPDEPPRVRPFTVIEGGGRPDSRPKKSGGKGRPAKRAPSKK
jgi:hypothetical protein